MSTDPRVHAGGGARDQNVVYIHKIGFLRLSLVEVYTCILITTCQKAFILAQ